jgi:hypothetical protein
VGEVSEQQTTPTWRDVEPVAPLPFALKLLDRRGDGAHYHAPLSGLSVIVSAAIEDDGHAWGHLSVAMPTRLPSWTEMRALKDAFVGDREAVTVHPRQSNYVSIHRFCLHLFWRLDGTWPLPEFSGVVAGRRTI